MQSEQQSTDNWTGTVEEAMSAILAAIGELERRVQIIEANQTVFAAALKQLGLVVAGHQAFLEAATETPRPVRAAGKHILN